MFCKLSQAIAALPLLLLVSCSRQPAATASRIAVLRFENVAPDPSTDWMGRAASEIITREISTGQTTVISTLALHANPLAQFRPVSAPGESAEFSAAVADGATRIVLGQISRAGNRLMLDVTERDPASGKTLETFTLASPDSGNLYALADAAARRLSPQVVPFESKNNQAIAAWAQAMEESDYSKANGDYARAVQADPDFASAWLAWLGTASARGDREAAAKILTEASQHANRFSDVNRSRLKLAGAQLNGDRAAALAAMNELGRLLPDDVDNLRAIADRNFAARQYATAVSGYRRLTQLTPNDALLWNQLGYALVYAGDHDGAMSALQTYQRLVPNDPNPFDSQGDAAFAFGRFAEAEKLYEQAAAKDPSFENSSDLYKAAEAHLMTGDVAGADKKFETYAAARRTAKDAALPFRTAQWRFLSGKHDEALASLATLLASPDPQFKAPQFRALALTQKAIWEFQMGRRDAALQDSGEALKTGAASPTTLIARFASEDARTAADWSARAERMLASPQLAQLRPAALAYALYMSHDWQAAEPAWKLLVERSGPDDTISPVIYADILVELKRPRDAEPLVRLFPLPRPNGQQEFLSLAIPKIFDTRAAVLEAGGKIAEAEASRKVFKALWGGE